MDRHNTARINDPSTATIERSPNTHFALLLKKLAALDAPRTPLRDLQACHTARVKAVQWFNRLDTSDNLDKLWPRFEKWLNRRPENLETYLAVERTCRTLEELRRWCPAEGSEAAEELLRLGKEEPPSLKARLLAATRRIVVTTTVVMNLVAVYLVAR